MGGVPHEPPKPSSPLEQDELSLEILEIVQGGRREPYSKGDLEELARKIHVPEPTSPGLVIPPHREKDKP